MKIIEGALHPKLVIICCLHGDEILGAQLFDYLSSQPQGSTRLILANEEARKLGARFVDEDINRCFPGDSNGNHEQRLAAQIMPYIKGVDIVLDIHTTTSNIKMTPIVTRLNNLTKKVINLCDSQEIVLMDGGMSGHSLIGQVNAGVSLEYGSKYDNNKSLKDLITLVTELRRGVKNQKIRRKIFNVSATIPNDVNLKDAKNFEKFGSPAFYPFLLNEKSYKTHQGFMATRITEEEI